MASKKTVDEVRARLTGAKRPTASKGTPPRGGKTTGTPKTKPSGGQTGIAPKKTRPTTPDVDLGQRRRPTATSGTPPRGGKTTGTPKTKPKMQGPNDQYGGTIVPKKKPSTTPDVDLGQRRRPNPPKKLTVTTGRRKPLRNSRSPFVFEYK